ncbi:MAG TPA: hypothetical protein PLE75_04780 [Ferruginibacter sp.]|nr:hypothetical protein [Ferruginibacter sp.]HRO05979.1 hypothetical protein [Ferruginibacter sp.]HRO97242.1 hypothetical protein [Ferruginibacter sp.]HRP49862.1 hypothetical protein [Ferruginibacter sp.]
MNQTYIHLLMNHIPVVGTIFALFVLLYGIMKRSYHTQRAAYFLLILAAIGSGITFFTGEGAEEFVEDWAGFSKSAIEDHEDVGKLAWLSMLLVAVGAAGALILMKKKSDLYRSYSYIMVLIVAVSISVSAYAGFLGGKIRHTEVHGTAQDVSDPDE